MSDPRRRTIFHELAETIWRTLRADPDFEAMFPAPAQLDHENIFRQPLSVSGADCPLVAIRVASIDEQWATNVSKDFRVTLACDIWLATDDQADILEAYAIVRRPLDDQLNLRFGLSYLIDFTVGEATNFRTIKELDPEGLTQAGVMSAATFNLVYTLRRNPRDAGLYV